MKYAIKFYQNCRVLDKADEIIINYDKKNVHLIDFVQDYSDNKRIILNLTMLENIEDNLKIFAAALKKHKNLSIMLSLSQRDNIVNFEEINIPYFFVEGVDSWDKLASQVKLGASDVYVQNELGFDLKAVSAYCKENNVKIRVCPNVAQSSSTVNNLDTFLNFFIRPEDLNYYNKYIDVIEFYGPLDRQAVLYEIYHDDKKWEDDLSLLIFGLNQQIENNTIVPIFPERRSNCRKICLNNKCNLCEIIKDTANILKDSKIEIRMDKNECKINEDSIKTESVSIKRTNAKISEGEVLDSYM